MGLSIIKPDSKIDFIGLRKITLILSLAVLLCGVASLLIKGGPKYGIDFSGGILAQVRFEQAVTPQDIKDSLASSSIQGLSVQRFGEGNEEYLLRISSTGDTDKRLPEILKAQFGQSMPNNSFTIERLDMVGPKIGADLRSAAVEALYFAVLLIAIYISGRFEQRWFTAGIMAAGLVSGLYMLDLIGAPKQMQVLIAMLLTLGICWKLKLNYALGAVVALIHDVLITIGVLSILGKEFDLTIVAALLTIVGYSLNDTIIVFDRIRENIYQRTAPTYGEVINKAVNQTLSRTLLTSCTTLLVLVSLFFFGGGIIHDFALTLLVGVAVGTYSSIFVASPVLYAFSPNEIPEPEVESHNHADGTV
ncbi:protein translocase subunit SecF [Halodesulfovibrio sp.]|jgi:preprotein translocase subunit SecF|uniref:protein translocase subunit SecF n=1 Tax=Halodesulfovibrio sp. TaxID=1912772 RepID=UPI0025CC02E4|nr:protein translocase subunit SecF [Halodesulfovibrio sp.]MCT4533920.1 protein translocase subunit SecF [Halodesulfovibrio sp.]MCT4628152.1 protein translocase subunit SecF [Halodesulfovibrio sp.]